METIELVKLFIAIVSVLGTIVVARLHTIKATKIRVEILKEFEEAIKHKSKNSVTEIFRMLYGLRMDYEDIVNLVEDNSVNQIIFALRRTPGLVKYKDGNFDYSELHNKFYMRIMDKIGISVLLIFSIVLIVFFAILMASSKNLFQVGVCLVFVILSSLGLVFGFNELRYNKIIDNLIKKE